MNPSLSSDFASETEFDSLNGETFDPNFAAASLIETGQPLRVQHKFLVSHFGGSRAAAHVHCAHDHSTQVQPTAQP
jgi:hypothetical protein